MDDPHGTTPFGAVEDDKNQLKQVREEVAKEEQAADQKSKAVHNYEGDSDFFSPRQN